MMKFIAVQKLYPNVVTMFGDDAVDAEGNTVEYDEAAVQAEIDSTAYLSKRQAEYPPFADYLDGLVKGDQSQIDAYIAACLAVKAKYPKTP